MVRSYMDKSIEAFRHHPNYSFRRRRQGPADTCHVTPSSPLSSFMLISDVCTAAEESKVAMGNDKDGALGIRRKQGSKACAEPSKRELERPYQFLVHEKDMASEIPKTLGRVKV
ncbi:hypothetical protein BHE74_00004420 [Ensete ventricosum]|nr:hypothetical protein BHE74_00004420 [Ensete ventricosum]